MIARLRTRDDYLETPQSGDTRADDMHARSNPVMGRITADYDGGVLTLRGTVNSLEERQFAEEAYTALGARTAVRNLIRITTPARAK